MPPWGGATEHENIPPFEGGQRSRRGREGDVQPRPEQGHPPGGCATTPLKGGFSQKPSMPRCRATFDEMLASANQRFGEAQRTP